MRLHLHRTCHAAPRLQTAGLKLLIEPINQMEVPGFWLNHTDMAAVLIDELGLDNV